MRCVRGAAAVLGGCGDVTLSELNTEKYVTLGEYKGLEVSLAAPEVSEDYQQNYIDYVLSRNAQWVEVTGRTVQDGDMVNIDYVGTVDGEAFDGGTATGYDLQIGSGTFIDGFEDGLVGAEQGETVDVPVTIPDPYLNNTEMSGVDAVFTVTVNQISEKQTPELTDEFVQGLEVGCDTVAEYEDYVYELLMQEAQNSYDTSLEDELIDQAMSNATFLKDPPKAMTEQYYDRAVRNLTRIATASGMSLETLITQYYQSTMEEFEEQAREGAATSCQEAIMLQAIANQEGITVSQEERDAYMQEVMESGGYESVDELEADMGEEDYEDFVMCQKVLDFMKENAVITE